MDSIFPQVPGQQPGQSAILANQVLEQQRAQMQARQEVEARDRTVERAVIARLRLQEEENDAELSRVRRERWEGLAYVGTAGAVLGAVVGFLTRRKRKEG